MKSRIPQLGSWQANVEQLETDALEVWARPLLTMVTGFALAATALLADRIMPVGWRDPAELAVLICLAVLALVTLWRTRGTAPEALSRQIVARVTRARALVMGLPVDLRTTLADELGRLSSAISPIAVAALAALAVLVCTLAATAAVRLTGTLAPELGMLNVASGLALAALLLPGYVRLLTLTAAQRLEERAVLVERLAEIASGR